MQNDNFLPHHSLYLAERPREKLKRRGIETLNNLELLQLLIGSGVKGRSVEQIALELETLIWNPDKTVDLSELLSVKGMSTAKSTALLAALEIGNRLSAKGYIIEESIDILPLLWTYADKKQEHLLLATLDGASKLIQLRVLTVGTLTSTLIHPREIFAEALQDRAASIIIAHNHPSGNPTPSQDDMRITDLIERAGELIGIPLIDHLIFTKDRNWTSICKSK